MPRLKRPDGWLREEFVCTGDHLFEDGAVQEHRQDTMGGEYTGRFCFTFTPGGRTTRWYTEATAPLWLLAYYEESTASQ